MAKKQDEVVVSDSMALAIATIEKAHGKGAIMFGNRKAIPGVEFKSSGCLGIDKALGGGWGKGRIIEVFGPESCIYRDSQLPYEVWSADDKERINHKGGTIGRLYERFHNTTLDHLPKQGRHLQTKKAVKFYIKSVNDEGSVIRNEVLDVVKTGEKVCIQVAVENGNSLIATPEHKFLTPEGYKPLADLEVGSTVFVHNNTRRQGRKYYQNRPETCVKYHPHLPTKIVHDKKTGNDYLYYRGQTSRLAYEAFMNKTSLHHYINVLNQQSKEKIDKLWFLPSHLHVHHKDENFMNNEITNLALIDPSEHGRLHAKDRHANLSFVMVPTKIVMKEIVGPRETYDLKCLAPYNNYIAEGIVVHNSGKTTLSLHAIAAAQKRGEIAAFIDVEHAFDPDYAEVLGINTKELAISQPGSGEEALQIVEMLTGAVDIIVVDSVAALLPRAEIEKDIGDHTMGRQAGLMSQAMRKLSGKCFRTGTTLMFINQIRFKIGVMFGNPETQPGGNALKFYSSQRVDIRRIGAVKDGETVVANKTRLKVVKNKLAPPFINTEFEIRYGVGIDLAGDLLDQAVEAGIVKKAGSWYSMGEERLGQGKVAVTAKINADPKLWDSLWMQVTQPSVVDVKLEE